MCSKSLAIWLRWLAIKTSVWRQMGGATIDLMQSRDPDRAKSRLLISLTKLNLLVIYEILEDLIRFPPY